jgi:hypothetical protein
MAPDYSKWRQYLERWLNYKIYYLKR